MCVALTPATVCQAPPPPPTSAPDVVPTQTGGHGYIAFQNAKMATAKEMATPEDININGK